MECVSCLKQDAAFQTLCVRWRGFLCNGSPFQSHLDKLNFGAQRSSVPCRSLTTVAPEDDLSHLKSKHGNEFGGSGVANARHLSARG